MLCVHVCTRTHGCTRACVCTCVHWRACMCWLLNCAQRQANCLGSRHGCLRHASTSHRLRPSVKNNITVRNDLSVQRTMRSTLTPSCWFPIRSKPRTLLMSRQQASQTAEALPQMQAWGHDIIMMLWGSQHAYPTSNNTVNVPNQSFEP